ncbi:MAG TPA: hypothetical protein DCY88_32540 [Cyanobacteria bacterium UBA11372]|nr:hypothetical protein [Cyanobacteria bacterium UBA11372]
MTMATSYTNVPDVSADDYLVVGLATCFIKEDGEVHQVPIVEPIPSAALEAIVKGIPTSYQMAVGTTLGAVLAGDRLLLPAEFPAQAQFGAEFASRAIAAVRTYKRKPAAKNIIPPGTIKNDFNYSVDRKRVLNSQRIIRTEDNVKQHEYTHKVL